jgi:hypothetical protein
MQAPVSFCGLAVATALEYFSPASTKWWTLQLYDAAVDRCSGDGKTLPDGQLMMQAYLGRLLTLTRRFLSSIICGSIFGRLNPWSERLPTLQFSFLLSNGGAPALRMYNSPLTEISFTRNNILRTASSSYNKVARLTSSLLNRKVASVGAVFGRCEPRLPAESCVWGWISWCHGLPKSKRCWAVSFS